MCARALQRKALLQLQCTNGAGLRPRTAQEICLLTSVLRFVSLVSIQRSYTLLTSFTHTYTCTHTHTHTHTHIHHTYTYTPTRIYTHSSRKVKSIPFVLSTTTPSPPTSGPERLSTDTYWYTRRHTFSSASSRRVAAPPSRSSST